MFLQTLAIACGAGLASALLFVVAAKGTMLAALLAAFAPLPVMIAALGWTHWAGLLALATGGFAISLALPAPLALVFAVGLAGPAWALARLALLADPPLGADDVPPDAPRLWYPVARLAVWAAAAGIFVATGWAALLMWSTGSGLDFDAAVGAVARRLAPGLEALIGRGGLAQGVSALTFAEALLRALPPAAAASTTAMMLANLWVAGRIVELSGRMPRPRAAIAFELTLPRAMLAALAGGLVVAFLGGLPGALGWIVAAAAGAVFVLQGLATIHVLTRDWSQRRTALLALYLVVVFFAWSLAVIGLIGVADSLFGLRARSLSQSPPTGT